MSSSVPPLPTAMAVDISKLRHFLNVASGYIKTHEKFLLVIIGCVLLWGVSGKVQDVIAAHDQKQYAAATATLKAQVDTNALLAQSNGKLAEDYKLIATQVLADNRRLEKESAALRDALAKQQSVDRNLPAPDLARRIETLAKIPTGSITPAANDTFAATHDGAVGIAVELEKVPALEGQLDNARQEKTNVDKQLVAANASVDGLTAEVGGLKAEVKKAGDACDARVKVVKDAAAKGKRKWFIAGYVAGLATRALVKLFGGV